MKADLTALLAGFAVGATAYAGYKLIRFVFHRMAHRFNWAIGPQVMWRRKTDAVIMTGWRCPFCDKVCGIAPNKSSYTRMVRGSSYF
jgi:hypothetical protein